MLPSSNEIWPISGALRVGFRLMNWKKLWCVEYGLIIEGCEYFLVSRGIDPGQNLLQVSAGPLELHRGESGEDEACQQRRTTSAFWSEWWVLNMNAKIFEASQGREAG